MLTLKEFRSSKPPVPEATNPSVCIDVYASARWHIPMAGMLYTLRKLYYWGSLAYADRRNPIYARTEQNKLCFYANMPGLII